MVPDAMRKAENPPEICQTALSLSPSLLSRLPSYLDGLFLLAASVAGCGFGRRRHAAPLQGVGGRRLAAKVTSINYYIHNRFNISG